jgi:glycosyltransferase involved in cell wall biosynthesis
VSGPTIGDGPRVAVVHEQLGDFGGSERGLAAILHSYPEALLVAPHFEKGNSPVKMGLPWPNPTRLVDCGGAKRHFLAPLYARRLSRIDLGRPDLVLTLAHHGWSLAAAVPRQARQVAYLAGPPRFLHGQTDLYLRNYPPALRPFLRASVPVLRRNHRRLLRRPDRLLAASDWSARELERLYGRSAEVVYPPVKTDFFTPAPRKRGHIVVVSRLVAQKQVEVVLEAFRELPDALVVVGGGERHEALTGAAPPNVRFTGFLEDFELRELYRSSIALICPSLEEFGIVMAEALACGVPVIAPRARGAREIVEDGRTGILLDRVDASSLRGAVRSLPELSFSPEACRASVERFAEARFVTEIKRVIDEELEVAARGRVGEFSVDGSPSHRAHEPLTARGSGRAGGG